MEIHSLLLLSINGSHTFRSNADEFDLILEEGESDLTVVHVVDAKLATRVRLHIDVAPFELRDQMPNQHTRGQGT